MSHTALSNVFTPEGIVWHRTDLGRDFWVSDDLVGAKYSKLFSAQLTKFAPGGGSQPHRHDYSHAFYFLTGTACVRVGNDSRDTTPGTFVKRARQ